jgi:hypothetical protein
MTTTETCHHRGYEILPWHLWSSWCVGVYRTRADLPLMSQSPLFAFAPRKEDALGEARQSIDRILSEPSWGCTFYGQRATNEETSNVPAFAGATPATKADCEKASMKWNATTNKCEKGKM